VEKVKIRQMNKIKNTKSKHGKKCNKNGLPKYKGPQPETYPTKIPVTQQRSHLKTIITNDET